MELRRRVWFFLLLDAAEGSAGFGPEAEGLEVLDCAAGGVLAGGFLGGEERGGGAEWFGVVVEGEQAGEVGAELVVGVGWLRGGGGALEFWEGS